MLFLNRFLLNFIFDSLADQVENRLILDGNSKKGLGEFLVAQANEILLGDNFIFGQIFEDNHNIFGVNDQRAQLKGVEEVPPGVVYNLVVVFLLGEGEVGLVDEEVEECFKVGFVF